MPLLWTPRNLIGNAEIVEGIPFNWNELTMGMTRVPTSQAVVDNIVSLVRRVGPVRKKIGRPMRVTSGFRTPEANEAAGGVKNSYHLSGMAMDFFVPGMGEAAVYRMLDHDWDGGLGLYDRGGDGWIHIDIGPRRRWEG